MTVIIYKYFVQSKPGISKRSLDSMNMGLDATYSRQTTKQKTKISDIESRNMESHR